MQRDQEINEKSHLPDSHGAPEPMRLRRSQSWWENICPVPFVHRPDVHLVVSGNTSLLRGCQSSFGPGGQFYVDSRQFRNARECLCSWMFVIFYVSGGCRWCRSAGRLAAAVNSALVLSTPLMIAMCLRATFDLHLGAGTHTRAPYCRGWHLEQRGNWAAVDHNTRFAHWQEV